jgi:23S rRNA (guanosine2251-2'-O)-methyltransferase
MQKKTMPELERISKAQFSEAKKTPLILILDNVRSMNNVGSVFRTADVFVLEAIYLVGITPCPPHRDINKTALGATETVRWKHFENMELAINDVKNKNYCVMAIEQVHGSVALEKFEMDSQQAYALVLGNEVSGVSDEALALCQGAIELNQAGSKHSLNVSVTTGIVAWHFFTQYQTPSKKL